MGHPREYVTFNEGTNCERRRGPTDELALCAAERLGVTCTGVVEGRPPKIAGLVAGAITCGGRPGKHAASFACGCDTTDVATLGNVLRG